MKLNREHAAALRAALPLLWDGVGVSKILRCGYSDFICHCLESAAAPGEREVRMEILRRLEGEETLDRWLIQKHRIKGDPKQIQAHRRAWMLLMIQEGES